MDLETKKQLSIVIKRLHHHVLGKTSVISKRFNLTPPQQFILFILFTANSPLLMKEIGSLGGWERSTVTRLLKQIKRKEAYSDSGDKAWDKGSRVIRRRAYYYPKGSRSL